MLAADWLNPGQSLDVNDDLLVTPIDSLIGINSLNQLGSRSLNAIGTPTPPPYYDVSGDGHHSPIDVLLVINALRSNTPVVAARLAHDSTALGGTDRDRVTREARLIGKARNLGDSIVEYSLDGGPFAVVFVGHDGDFSFTPGLSLEGTDDGPHTLQFRARAADGTDYSEFDLDFTLDTLPPAEPIWDLATLFDSPPLGDGSTTLDSVTLVGQTSAGALIRLLETGATTTANAQGAFSFNSVALQAGANTFTITATDAAGNSSQSTRTISRGSAFDSTPPQIALDTPASIRLRTNITVSGQVTDEAGAIESLWAQVDLNDVSQVALDVDGRFTFTTSLPLNGVADGQHLVRFRATDSSGNISPLVSLTWHLDTRPPLAATEASGTLSTRPNAFDIEFSESMSDEAFSATNYAIVATSGSNVGRLVPVELVTRVGDSVARIAFGAPLENGSYRLTLASSVTDLAGNTATPVAFDFIVLQSTQVSDMSPADGEGHVSVTRETVVRFDHPVDPASVNTDSFYLIANGERVPGRVHVSSTERFATFFYDTHLPASTAVRVFVDGNHILGRDGMLLDADGDGTPGGVRQVDFRTLPLTLIPGTEVWGYVYDSYNKAPQETLPIEVPTGDPQFDPTAAGTRTIPFTRAEFFPGTGTSVTDPRLHPNKISSFIDASMVYGSSETIARALRRLDGSGKLKTSPGDLLPLNDSTTFPHGTLPNDNKGSAADDELFVAGDVRSQENPQLAALHTLLLREHNRKADEITAVHSTWSDEEVFQAARRWVSALIQHITYQEFLPTMLGEVSLPLYGGYQPSVDPGISPLFSTAAFRVGHTLQTSDVARLDASGSSLPGGPLSLRDVFFDPEPLKSDGIDPYLRGLIATPADDVDLFVLDDLRNFLFGPPGAGGMDLAAINIQRGRDMGLPSYNQARRDMGLSPVSSFDQITSNATVAMALQAVYGDVESIDLWVGGLAEDRVPNGMVGSLFATIIQDQFRRSRDGDRFWYENGQLSEDELTELRGTTLADVVTRNSALVDLPRHVLTTGTINPGPTAAGSAGMATEARTYDGYGNNESQPRWGRAGEPLIINYTVGYGDGVSSPAGADRPSPRAISNTLLSQPSMASPSTGATQMFVTWGQFIDHDLSFTPAQSIDGTDIPVIHATVSLDALPGISATTDRFGYFILTSPEGLPAPDFFVHIDGSTAVNAPAGTAYATLGKPFHGVPGHSVQLNMAGAPFDIYLPPMAMSDIVPLSLNEDTAVGFGTAGMAQLETLFPDLDPIVFYRMRVTYPAGSAQDENGNPATRATVVPVAPDRLPAPLPPGVDPPLVISVQAGTDAGFNLAGGSTNFSVPAPVTFPNLDGLAAGEKSLIWSFDHDAGKWVVIGTGTVTADGLNIESDPGVGILAPGWHFTQPGTQANGRGGNDGADGDRDGDNDKDKKKKATFEFGITADGTIPIINAGITVEVQIPGLVSFSEDFSFLGDQRMFGPTELLSSTLQVESDGIVAQALRQFAGTLELVSVGAKIRGQIGVTLTTGGFFVKKDDSHGRLTLPGISLGSLTWTVTAGGAACRVAGYFIGFSALCGKGITYGLDLGVSGRQLLLSAGIGEILVPLEDTDGDGRPGPALESGAYGITFSNGFFVEVDFGTYHLTGFLREQTSDTLQRSLAASDTLNQEVGFSEIESLSNEGRTFYRFIMRENGAEIAGRTNGSWEFTEVLPSNSEFTLYLYNLKSNKYSVQLGTTSASGIPTVVSTQLEFFGGADTDFDRIPDIGELTIGTSPALKDTDGDGISDDAELAQGLDPLGGRAFPTGIVASLPLLGESREIVVTGLADDVTQLTAYVATGSHGLAIVDVSRFDDPIILGQWNLEGTALDVAVDATLGLAAVGTTVGLQIVDVRDPQQSRLVRIATQGAAQQVEVVDGVAYVGSGAALQVVDIATGLALQTLALPMGPVHSMARDGQYLYIYGSATLTVVDISTPGDARVVGQLTGIVISDVVRAFAGNGVVYLGGAGRATPNGLVTIDVSDPSSPQLISGPDFFFDARSVAANGSGLALIGSEVAGRGIGIYNVSDPANTNGFLTQIAMPGPSLGVTIAAGIGFVAAGSSGLHVVNYLPFDNRGLPPTVVAIVDEASVDSDPTQPGIQVLEGSRIPVRAVVSDDVQVRNVELLVNGEVVQNAVSFPFQLNAIAPPYLEGVGSGDFTVQLRATDTGGNRSESSPITIQLRPDTLAPTIDRFELLTPDVNPSRPGVQVFEGTDLRVGFAATDQGGMDRLELLLDGQVVDVQERAAGIFSINIPRLPDGNTLKALAVQLRATDMAGNSRLTDPLRLEVLEDSIAPRMLHINLEEGERKSLGRFSLAIDFDEPLDRDAFSSSWFGISDPQGRPLAPERLELIGDDNQIRAIFSFDESGPYELLVNAPLIVDRVGNSVGAVIQTTKFMVGQPSQPLYPGARIDVLATEYQGSVAAGDFNEDGITDLISTGSSHVFLFPGRGGGLYGDPLLTQVTGGATSIVVGDFNADTHLDWATVNRVSHDIAVGLGNGDGTFQPATRYATGVSPVSLAIADVNGDGSQDLVAANEGSSDLSVLLGTGVGTFVESSTLSLVAGAGPLSVIAADMNGDGHQDLVTANSNHENISVLLGMGNGEFSAPVSHGIFSGIPMDVVAADFDGDGNMDIAVAVLGFGNFDGRIRVLFGNADGTLGPSSESLSTNGDPLALVAQDLDGDGHVDIASATARNDVPSVSLFRGNGDRTFQRSSTLETIVSRTNPVAIISTDLDDDGIIDLAVANGTGRALTLLFGEPQAAFMNSLSFPTGTSPTSLASADFDDDSQVDLVIANRGSGDVSIRMGVGDGTFADEVRIVVGSSPAAVATGDFDRDGNLDFIVAVSGSDEVALALSNGDGTHEPLRRFGVGDGPESLVVGDFDNDGFLDLATANWNSDDVSILWGFGDGSFHAAQSLRVGDGPVGIIAGDFDGNGMLDLATANANSDDVSILIRDSTRTFRTQLRVAAGDSPTAIQSGDFDIDGQLDIAIASFNSRDLSVFLGVGDGTFGPRNRISLRDAPSDLTTADFNGDGLLDLATGPHVLQLLLGNGDGTFQTPHRFRTTYDNWTATSALPVDLNGDGQMDIVTLDHIRNVMWVFLNQQYERVAPASLMSYPLEPNIQPLANHRQIDAVFSLFGGD